MIYRLTKELIFPDPSEAEPDGLLAIGGDLSPERLLLAYRSGIFPWFNEDEFIMWFSPHQRFVLFPDKLKVSSSMKRVLKAGPFQLTVDQDFRGVIKACAAVKRKGQPLDASGQAATWITKGMIKAYCRLHEMGHAHSVEAWQNGELAGGLYGVSVGRIFCGESMFSTANNASKAALIHLARHLDYTLIDCQVFTPHMASLGASFIPRKTYEKYLEQE